MRVPPPLVLPLVFALLHLPGAAHAEPPGGDERRIHVDLEAQIALFAGAERHPLIDPGFGWAGRIRYAPAEGFGFFLHLEQSLWLPTQTLQELPSLLNVGLGAEYRFAGGRVRSAAAIGTSTLLFTTPIDRAGATGLFLDVRPLGLRWPLGERFSIGVDPLTFALEAPVLTGLPLVRIQHRSIVVTEARF